MKKARERERVDSIEKNLKTDGLKLDPNFCHLSEAVLLVVLYRTLCDSLQQCATLPQLRTCNIFSICLLLLPLLSNKRIQFCRFPEERGPFWLKVLVPLVV